MTHRVSPDQLSGHFPLQVCLTCSGERSICLPASPDETQPERITYFPCPACGGAGKTPVEETVN
jgi:hypothetical protein